MGDVAKLMEFVQQGGGWGIATVLAFVIWVMLKRHDTEKHRLEAKIDTINDRLMDFVQRQSERLDRELERRR